MKPDAWPGPDTLQPNSAVRKSKHFLSEDFCVLNGEHHFVRCRLPLPIVGSQGATFGFGVWSSLSAKNFQTYVTLFGRRKIPGSNPWFGWFSNGLIGYPDTFNLKCHVHPQQLRQRPLIELEPTDHPLAVEQRDGISFDRLLEIYAANGHDIRGALAE